MSEEDKATQYVNQKMMPHLINQQSMAEKPLFTSLDLKAAYEKGYKEGYSEGRKESLLDHLKKNKDEEKNEFKPFDKVLVRDEDGVWFAGIFSHLRGDGQFFCAGGNLWEQCLPYNDQTAHLLGTSNDPE